MDNIKTKLGFKGHFTLYKGEEGGERTKVADFDNLITNGGMDALGNGQNWSTLSCVVGTGNTAPAFTDTTLASKFAETTSNASGEGATGNDQVNYRAGYIWAKRFSAGTFDNTIIAEVGMENSSNTLVSRALVLDGGGSPTTITLSSTEYLDVYYTIYTYFDETDTTGTISDGATSYDYTARLSDFDTVTEALFNCRRALITAYSGGIGATINDSPAGEADEAGGASGVDTYITGSYSTNMFSTFREVDANFTTSAIKSLVWDMGTTRTGIPKMQIEFTPAISKNSLREIKFTYSVSWARV